MSEMNRITPAEALESLTADSRSRSEKTLLRMVSDHVNFLTWHKAEEAQEWMLKGDYEFVILYDNGAVNNESGSWLQITDGKLCTRYTSNGIVMFFPIPMHPEIEKEEAKNE